MSYTSRQRECIQVTEGGKGYRNIMKQLYCHRKCLYELYIWRNMFHGRYVITILLKKLEADFCRGIVSFSPPSK